jgi:FG-GAP-like repeat
VAFVIVAAAAATSCDDGDSSTSGVPAAATSVTSGSTTPQVVPTTVASPVDQTSPATSVAEVTDETATVSFAGAWVDVTNGAIGVTGEWTNKVELADVNGDGHVDVLFANGGDYESPGTPVLSRVFLNSGDGTFTDVSEDVLGAAVLLTRVIKVYDVNRDGHADILLGTTFQTQSRLLLGVGDGSFTDVTATQLPAVLLSAGDLEVGDVDADGDLDIVIADWGAGSPLSNDGGFVHLWLNDGQGAFADATTNQMPNTLVGFSWDLELVDVDNDWDLDVAVSCKTCQSSQLYVNDGAGTFTDVTATQMPAFTNNYEFAPIDLDADGFLDLVTINDGGPVATGGPEHVFRNDGTGTFVDITRQWWPPAQNRGWDDNVVVGLDVESDGDADFLIGSLNGSDRLLLNDGTGALTAVEGIFDAAPSRGTLGMAIADLNGDARPDVVEGQGEAPGHQDERIYLATDAIGPDTAPPHMRTATVGATILGRISDHRTPNAPHDWQSITARWNGGQAPMTWYGENLFRATVPTDAGPVTVCAVDAAGNETCSS